MAQSASQVSIDREAYKHSRQGAKAAGSNSSNYNNDGKYTNPSPPNRESKQRLLGRHLEALNKSLASGFFSLKDYIQTHRVLGIPFVLDDAIIVCPVASSGAQRLNFWKKLLTTSNYARSSQSLPSGVESKSNFINKQLTNMYASSSNGGFKSFDEKESLANSGQELSNTTLGSLGSQLGRIQVKTTISMQEFSSLLESVEGMPLPELERRHGTIFGEIERDISRTFRGSDLFASNSQGEKSIGRILRALALKLPEVGYCQGMNFVAATILLTRLPSRVTLNEEAADGDEEEGGGVEDKEENKLTDNEGNNSGNHSGDVEVAEELGMSAGDISDEPSVQPNDFGISAKELRQIEFEVYELMVILMDSNSKFKMSSLWRPGVPNIKLRVYQFDRLLHLHFPKLHAHFNDLHLAPEILVSQWFITLFSYSFHWLSSGRLWDYIFYGGFPALFRVSLALLALLENELLELDLEGVSNLLKDWKFGTKKHVDNSITRSFKLSEMHSNSDVAAQAAAIFNGGGHGITNIAYAKKAKLNKVIRYHKFFAETVLIRARSIVVSSELLKSLQDSFSLEMVEMSQRSMKSSSSSFPITSRNASSEYNGSGFHNDSSEYGSNASGSPGKGFRLQVRNFVKDLLNFNDGDNGEGDDGEGNNARPRLTKDPSFFDPPKRDDDSHIWLLRYGNRANSTLHSDIQTKLIDVKNQLLIIDKCVSIETEAIQEEISNVVSQTRSHNEKLSDVTDNQIIITNQITGFSLSLYNEIEFAKSIRKKIVLIQMNSTPKNADNDAENINSTNSGSGGSSNSNSNSLASVSMSMSSGRRDEFKNDVAFQNMAQVNLLVDHIYNQIGEIESEGSSTYSGYESEEGDEDYHDDIAVTSEQRQNKRSSNNSSINKGEHFYRNSQPLGELPGDSYDNNPVLDDGEVVGVEVVYDEVLALRSPDYRTEFRSNDNLFNSDCNNDDDVDDDGAAADEDEDETLKGDVEEEGDGSKLPYGAESTDRRQGEQLRTTRSSLKSQTSTLGSVSNTRWYPGKYIKRLRSRRHKLASSSTSSSDNVHANVSSSSSSSNGIHRNSNGGRVGGGRFSSWFTSIAGEDNKDSNVGGSGSGSRVGDKLTSFLSNRIKIDSRDTYSNDASSSLSSNHHTGGNNNDTTATATNSSSNNSNNKTNNKGNSSGSAESEFEASWIIEAYDFDLFLMKISRSPWFSPYLLRDADRVIPSDEQDAFCKSQRLVQTVDVAFVNSIMAALYDRDADKLKNYGTAFYQSKSRLISLMQSVETLSSKLAVANDEIALIQNKIAKLNDNKEKLCNQLQALLRDARRDRQKNLQIISDIYD